MTVLFDGIYSWSGKKEDNDPCISWWPGSCWLRIIDRSKDKRYEKVVMAIPIIVLTAETGEGFSVKTHFQDLVRYLVRFPN